MCDVLDKVENRGKAEGAECSSAHEEALRSKPH